MQLFRHLTIRRVVLWIMILSLAVVALAGSYGVLNAAVEAARAGEQAGVLPSWRPKCARWCSAVRLPQKKSKN